MGVSELDLLLYVIGICVFLMPIALVSSDKRVSGQEKNAWLLATVLLSWLGWLVFVSTVKPQKIKTETKIVKLRKKKR
ncbi:hypothetical protein [Catenovulum adriaticum]|uniref:T4 superinfection immunity protein n=1 Tax=Catenovulum adriaticum TaxID=2984846 RepID=A0ABY7ALM5_9ALTE|nr:hypothetical protein [Catenovulum sp. TS8]WAJ70453.1 hypothetical protein OLW01_01145 [Catenovulum sp. TS8]